MFSAFGACRDCARKEAGGGREIVTPLVYFWGKLPTPTHRLGQIQQIKEASMRMPLLFGVKTVVDSNRGRLETCRGKSAMPLLEADKGMALFPQPQLLQGYANADLQKLNAARWICFNPRWPAAHGRSTPVPLAASPSPHAERWWCEPERR